MFILAEVNFLQTLCPISMYSVLNKLSEYIYFYISKNITLYTFVACLSKNITLYTFVACFLNPRQPSVYRSY